MLALRPRPADDPPRPDRFRDTMQRWRIRGRGQRPTVCDYVFCIDGSLTWRVVAGPAQGQVGRSREFHVQQVGPDLYLLSFAALPGIRITAAMDFRRGSVTGYGGPPDDSTPFTGTFETL